MQIVIIGLLILVVQRIFRLRLVGVSAPHQFVAASSLEEGGFELSVPVARGQNPFGKWNRHRGGKRSRNLARLGWD